MEQRQIARQHNDGIIQSRAALVTLIEQPSGCVGSYGLNRAQIAAINFYGNLSIVSQHEADRCEWIITSTDATPPVTEVWPDTLWEEVGGMARPTDKTDRLVVLHRRKR